MEGPLNQVTEQRGTRRFQPGRGPRSTAKTEAESHRLWHGRTELCRSSFCGTCNGLHASQLPKRKRPPLWEEVTGKQEQQVAALRRSEAAICLTPPPPVRLLLSPNYHRLEMRDLEQED